MRSQPSTALEKKHLRLDDEVRFIRSWLEKPLATGAVMPSGRLLARTMARYVDIDSPGPVIELPEQDVDPDKPLVIAGNDEVPELPVLPVDPGTAVGPGDWLVID